MSDWEMVMIKKSIIPPGYFGTDIENIVIIDNFISSKDIAYIQELSKSVDKFESIPGDNWNNRVANFSILSKNYIGLAHILSNYTNKLKLVIEERFDLILSERVPSFVIWRPGDSQLPHADKQNVDGSPNPYPENDIASLMYINDSYEGGEIYFEKQNISIKPKSGQAIFFPGDVNYIHGVTEVKNGVRYTCPNFWTVIKNNKTKEENV
jgi:hypothetical protein